MRFKTMCVKERNMRRKISRSFLVWCVLISQIALFLNQVQAAEIPKRPMPNIDPYLIEPTLIWAKNLKTFSGDDRHYVALRRQMGVLFKRGISPLSLFRKHLPAAKKGRPDSLFVLGLSAHQDRMFGSTTPIESGKRVNMVLELIQQLEVNKSLPQTYEFIRMRFCLKVGAISQFMRWVLNR